MIVRLSGVVLAIMLIFVSAGARPVQGTHLRTAAYAYTTAQLNLRSGAGTEYSIRRVIPKGAWVHVKSGPYNGEWYRVSYRETVGYAAGTYLKQPTSNGVRAVAVVKSNVANLWIYTGSPLGPSRYELATQAVLGEKVWLLGPRSDKGYYHAVVPGQKAYDDPRGYPGYISEKDLLILPAGGDYRANVQVVSFDARLVDSQGRTMLPLSSGSKLRTDSDPARLVGQVPVYLPDGRKGFLPASELAAIPLRAGSVRERTDSARQWLGRPYLWGGTSSLATGQDCSGFTYRVFERWGILLPRDATEQYFMAPNHFRVTAVDQLQVGDLVFLGKGYTYENRITHTGIYVGNGKYISSSGGKGVAITSVTDHPVLFGAARYSDEG